MRPPLIMGVPLIPFMLAIGIVTPIAVKVSFLYFLILPVLIIIMRMMVNYDEHIFSLLGIRMLTLIKTIKKRKKIGESIWISSSK